MIKKLSVKLPDYFKDFQCIGGKCEDTCCIGWDIDIDEETYKKYVNCENVYFQQLFKSNMYINDDFSNESVDYAKIKLNKHKRCPFLDDCNYCSIHSDMSEDYLSNTCSHFPRVLNKIDEEYEISLDIACPEAARIVLGQKDGISFNKDNVDLKKYIVAGEIDTNDEDYEDYPIKYFKEIRNCCISIIKNRDFDISIRLFILGDFLYRLEEKSDENCESVCIFIENYNVDQAAQFYIRNDLNYMMQISLLDNIVNSLDIYSETDSVLFKEYTKQAIEGFNIKSSQQLERDCDKYIDAFVNYSREYIDKNNYIFENYLVNFMYNNLFPYSESDSMFEGYIMMLIRYSLMRFYLVGKYLYNKKESTEDIIKFIQVFSKAIEHDKNYIEEILDYILENGFDNMEFAEMII